MEQTGKGLFLIKDGVEAVPDIGDTPASPSMVAAGAEFLVRQAITANVPGSDKGAQLYDFASRRRIDPADVSAVGGSGEGGGERPNRAQLIDTIHKIADGELGRHLYSSEKPILADEAFGRLGESVWLPSRMSRDGPKIGRLGEGLARVGGYKVKFEASYLNEDARQLVDRLTAEEYDMPIAKDHLKISIYDADIPEVDVDEDVDSELQVYVEFPTNAPAWFELILPPKRAKYPLILSRYLNELGLSDLGDLLAVSNAFGLPSQDEEEAVLGNINTFVRTYAAGFLGEDPHPDSD